MHPHDRNFYQAQIEKLPVAYRQKAFDGYAQTYKAAFDAEPIEHKKENKARYAANTRLREYVEKVLALK